MANSENHAGKESNVNNTVYLLWFVQEREQDEDTELLIGVYDSEAGRVAQAFDLPSTTNVEGAPSLAGGPGF